jgi:hypothetical protein
MTKGSELRRLGKRGSYRFGRLAGPPPPRPSLPRPHTPSFAPHRRGGGALWLLAAVGGVAAVTAGALAGWWFLPFVLGAAAGAASRYGRLRLRTVSLAVAVCAAAGWGAALAWPAVNGLPEGAVARTIAALAGLPPHAVVAIAVTLLVAVVQALCGLWLGRAVSGWRG